jgi:hypothetical protein
MSKTTTLCSFMCLVFSPTSPSLNSFPNSQQLPANQCDFLFIFFLFFFQVDSDLEDGDELTNLLPVVLLNTL